MSIELRPTARATQLAEKLRREYENMEYEILEHATREHDHVKMLMEQDTAKLQKTMQRVEQHKMDQQLSNSTRKQRSKSPTATSSSSNNNLLQSSPTSSAAARSPLGLFSPAAHNDNNQILQRSSLSSSFNNYDMLGKMSKLIPSSS